MKNIERNTLISIIICIISPIFVIILKMIIFNQWHGLEGFITHEPNARILFMFIYPISIISPIFYLLGNYLKYRNQEPKIIKIDRKISFYFLFINLILPIIFLFPSFGIPAQSGDKAPQLWLSSNQGANGLPDVGISFWTEKKTISEVLWGEEGFEGIKLIDNIARNSHIFMLEDLKQGSNYWFNYSGVIYEFSTPDLSDGISFAIVSDSHFSEDKSENTLMISNLNNILSNNNELLIHTGDLVNFGWIDEEWSNALSVMSDYTTKLPSRVLIGNHDGGLNGDKLHEFYCKPENLDDTSSPWQVIEIGDDIHFVMLSLEWSGLKDLGKEQLTWLNTTLSAIDPDDWTIIFSHAPFFSSDVENHIIEKGFMNILEPIFIENDVDLVFSGHNHIFEHLENSSINYFLVSRIGQKSYVYETVSPLSQEIINENGFVEVTINGDQADISFRNSTNNELYSVSIHK